jgi:hypothetical protein
MELVCVCVYVCVLGDHTVCHHILCLNNIYSAETELLSLRNSCKNWSRCSKRRITLMCSSARKSPSESACPKLESR